MKDEVAEHACTFDVAVEHSRLDLLGRPYRDPLGVFGSALPDERPHEVPERDRGIHLGVVGLPCGGECSFGRGAGEVFELEATGQTCTHPVRGGQDAVRRRVVIGGRVVDKAAGVGGQALETGDGHSRHPPPSDIATLLGRYGTDKAVRDRIMTIAHELNTDNFLRLHEGSPDTLAAVARHESIPRTVTACEPLAIPVLAQTEDCALALIVGPNAAHTRMIRQRRLRHPGSLETVLYVHEAGPRASRRLTSVGVQTRSSKRSLER